MLLWVVVRLQVAKVATEDDSCRYVIQMHMCVLCDSTRTRMRFQAEQCRDQLEVQPRIEFSITLNAFPDRTLIQLRSTRLKLRRRGLTLLFTLFQSTSLQLREKPLTPTHIPFVSYPFDNYHDEEAIPELQAEIEAACSSKISILARGEEKGCGCERRRSSNAFLFV